MRKLQTKGSDSVAAPQKTTKTTAPLPDRKTGSRFLLVLLVVSVAAIVLRLFASWEMSRACGGNNNLLTPPGTSDLATYMKLATEAARGNFPAEFYYQPYYYAVFLPLIYFFSGRFAIWAVVAVQSLLGGATVFLTGLCGRRIFDKRAGICAAVMTAISSPLILYTPFHQNETLQTFHLILLFYCTLRAVEAQKTLHWAVTGLVTGIAILTRGNVWLLLPVILFSLLYSEIKAALPARKIALHAGFLLGMLLLVQLPFIWRNSAARGGLTGPSTAANAVLALGNTPEAAAGGRDPGEPAGAMYYPEAYKRMMNNTQGPRGRSVPRQMWQWFCEEPLAFCELQFRKALLFWDGREIPNNVSLEYDGFASTLLRWGVIGRNQVLLSLSAAGLFWFLPRLRRKRELPLMLLYGFILFFYAAVTVFYMLSRFRAPLLPLLYLAGGAIPGAWCDYFRELDAKKRSEGILRMLVVLFCGIFLVCGSYEFYRFYLESPVARFLRPDGTILDMGGKDVQHFDHGPRPFGGWSDIEVKPGLVIKKRFARCGTEAGMLYFSVKNFDQVELAVTINGMPHEITVPATKPGKSLVKFIGIPAMLIDGRITIEVMSVSALCAFELDRQRDYGRSFLNGAAAPGEWVMRFGRRR